MYGISGFGQRRGNLRGKVTDQTGSVLPGANVLVDGTTLGAATDIDGIYLLQGITPGDSVKITVVYLGYEPVTKPVRIVAGETATLNFQLIEAANSIDGVVISAVVDGQQRALNQQRNSDNMMSVLSSDQMGRFPDLNVAEALQRLSGVTISRERGEGKTVQLRGTPANFTNINVNGEQIIGTSEEGGRAESLDLIPSDILASMEVQKTLLPSNDGDAIAGVVNHAHFDSPLPQSKRHDRPFVGLQRTAGQGALQYQGKLFAAFRSQSPQPRRPFRYRGQRQLLPVVERL